MLHKSENSTKMYRSSGFDIGWVFNSKTSVTHNLSSHVYPVVLKLSDLEQIHPKLWDYIMLQLE